MGLDYRLKDNEVTKKKQQPKKNARFTENSLQGKTTIKEMSGAISPNNKKVIVIKTKLAVRMFQGIEEIKNVKLCVLMHFDMDLFPAVNFENFGSLFNSMLDAKKLIKTTNLSCPR